MIEAGTITMISGPSLCRRHDFKPDTKLGEA